MGVESKDNSARLLASLRLLTEKEVLVGIPAGADARPDGKIGNAALGYIHETGAPEKNIPARPWLAPGVASAREEIQRRMEGAGRAAMNGDAQGVLQQFAGAGQDAVNAVRRRVQAGLSPPLAPATVARRRRRTPGSSYRRAATTAADTTPLIDTGDLIRSVTYVVRDRK